MNNYSNNEGTKLSFIFVFFLLIAAITWLSNHSGLDFATSSEVVTLHILFVIFIAAAVYTAYNLNFRLILIVPTGIASYLLCWRPALDYWSNQDFHNFSFNGSINYAWYATGWIQALILVTIISGGHGLIHYIDSRNSYR